MFISLNDSTEVGPFPNHFPAMKCWEGMSCVLNHFQVIGASDSKNLVQIAGLPGEVNRDNGPSLRSDFPLDLIRVDIQRVGLTVD